MGFRFRKSVRLFPGVRLNFSKSGISTSLGRPGASINLGGRGTRYTAGIPGSGMSYSMLSSSASAGDRTADGQSTAGCFGWIAVALVAIFGLAICSKSPAPDLKSSDAQSSLQTEQLFVSASQLNCRANPSANAPVVTRFPRGTGVDVVVGGSKWSHVQRSEGACWVSREFLVRTLEAAAPLALAAAAKAQPTIRPNGQRRSSSAHRNSEGCPCSGSHVCIGPRGGRYCITSGGNKRYGV